MKPLIVVPTYCTDQQDLILTKRCLRSIQASTEHHADMIVCDDGSPLQRRLQDFVLDDLVTPSFHPGVKNEGFSRTVNVGLEQARDEGRDAILLNADVELNDGAFVHRFYDPASDYRDPDREAPIQGGVLFFPTDPPLVQHAGVYFSVLRREFDHIHRYAPADLCDLRVWRKCPVTAACMFISNDALHDVGLFDEGFRMGWEDVDYCLRAFGAGYECWVNPRVRGVHHESVFRSKPDPKRARWTVQSHRHLWKKHAGFDFSEFVPTMLGV